MGKLDLISQQTMRLYTRVGRLKELSSAGLLEAAVEPAGTLHYLYAMGIDHYPGVKIGITKNPRARIKAISSLHCRELQYYVLCQFQNQQHAHRIELDTLRLLRAVWGKPHRSPPFSGKEWTKASPQASIAGIEECAKAWGMSVVRARL